MQCERCAQQAFLSPQSLARLNLPVPNREGSGHDFLVVVRSPAAWWSCGAELEAKRLGIILANGFPIRELAYRGRLSRHFDNTASRERVSFCSRRSALHTLASPVGRASPRGGVGHRVHSGHRLPWSLCLRCDMPFREHDWLFRSRHALFVTAHARDVDYCVRVW